MKCHSIFSFEWNSILTKSIHFFHWLIGSAQQHRAQVFTVGIAMNMTDRNSIGDLLNGMEQGEFGLSSLCHVRLRLVCRSAEKIQQN
jgi:hypothetical protein